MSLNTHRYILDNWVSPVIATNMLTANKFQFLGMMTMEYRDQMSPISKISLEHGSHRS